MYSFPNLEPVCCSMSSGPKPSDVSSYHAEVITEHHSLGHRDAGVSAYKAAVLLLFSCSVMSDKIFANPWTAACQFSCLLLFTEIWSNLCPLSQWCHPNISSSVVPTSSCPQSLLASRSFPVSQVFTPGAPSIGVSASATVLTMNIQGWFLLGLTDLISLLSKGLSRVFSITTVWKH